MTKSLTEGKPFRLIIGFAFPMFLGMLFQQCYNMVDTVIVGKFLGVEPLAGVGSTASVVFIVIGFCNGVCNGFGVPIAQMFGAKQEPGLRRFVANSAWLCILFSLGLTAAAVGLCHPILKLLNTPEDIYRYAYGYLVIIFWGIPFTFLYNMLAAILRSLGDSKTPVLFLAVSSVINVALDVAFILVFHMNVEGPALATVISQGLSGMICLWYMKKRFGILRMQGDEWKLRKDYCFKLCYIGVPMGLQYSITGIGSMVIQAAVNSFGSVAVAGVTAAQKINMFLTCPIEALGTTMASYAGQNMGAGRLDRVSRGLRSATLCGFGTAAVLFGVVLLFGREMTMLFLDVPDPQVLDYAFRFLIVSSAGGCLLVLVNTVRFTIQGMGFSMFAITAGVLEMIARTLAGTLGVKAFGFTGICFANVLAWIFADAFLIPAFFYCKRRCMGTGGKKKNSAEVGGDF